MRADTWTASYCHEEGSLPDSLPSRCNIATATRCNFRKITAALGEHSQAVSINSQSDLIRENDHANT